MNHSRGYSQADGDSVENYDKYCSSINWNEQTQEEKSTT